MRKIVLILTAIIGGSILGNLLALVAAAGIDASYGRSVTGGEWKFNLPNFLYAVFIGLLCGGFAGLIFKQKGWIIGGAAHILPGVVVFAIGFMNFSQNAPAIFSPNAWLWLVVGLVPAMLSGHFISNQYTEETGESDYIPLIPVGVRWHWLWLCFPLLIFLFFIAGSVRFFINLFFIEWQIIFRPSFWIIGIIGLPLIVGFLYLTLSLPITGWCALLSTLTPRDKNNRVPVKKRLLRILLIVIGIPLLLLLLWSINLWILDLFIANGFKIV